MPTPINKLPKIFIDLQQPGDIGDFFVTVSDVQTRKTILENRIDEERSYLQYVYTARLLETGVMPSSATSENDLQHQRLKHREEDLIRYGQMLYSDLFGKNNTFKQYLSKQAHLREGAQLVFRLHNTASELWNIPWEYMHDGTQFLGIQPQYPILRSLIDARLSKEKLEAQRPACPLRILMVISHPKDAPPLNVDTEVAMIRRAVKTAEDEGRIEIDFVEEGSLVNLEKAFLDDDYHVLHFSGHGSIAPQGSFLAMENEEGLTRPVFLSQLLPVLQQSKNLRFVFLSACRAGTISETKASSGIATGLLQVVPAVLAMQFSVQDRSASVLAESFYGSLGRGQTLEEAIHVARQSLHTTNTAAADWGVPVLYSHQPNIRLLDTRADVSTSRPRQRFDLSELPTFDPFVGRHDEQRVIRAALLNTAISSVYIWGMAGIGKSALVRRVLERTGERDLIGDVLILRCDKLKLPEIVGHISQWLAKHFPNAARILNDNTISPVQRLEGIAPYVRGKRLILVLDGLDHVLQAQADRHGEFPHALLTDYFQTLATAEWTVLTIFTSRLRWAKLPELLDTQCKEIHLGSLSFTDTVFLLQNLTHLKSAPPDMVGKFFGLVGGHPLTMQYFNYYLGKKPQRDALADPEFPKKLGAWWHTSFLADVFQRLQPAEREALRLLSVHGDVFDPQYVQLLVKLPTIEAAERIVVSWELSSLAYFAYTDEDDNPWYIVPSLVRTYVTSQIKPEKLASAHAEVSRVVQHRFFLNAQERHKHFGGPVPDASDEFNSVLTDIEIMPKRMSNPSAQRYMQMVYNWHHHLQEAGNIRQANKVALTMLPSLWIFRQHELTDDLIKLLLERIDEKSEDYVVIRYWEAIAAMEAGETEQASALLQTAEKLAQQQNDLQLLPQIMVRQGEVLRNQGKYPQAKRIWLKALEMYQRASYAVGEAQILLLLGEQTYFQGDAAEATRFIDSGLRLLSKTERINVNLRVVGALYLYKGHLFRKTSQDADALRAYSEARELGEQLSDGLLLGRSIESIGYTYGLLGQLDIAAPYLLQAVDIYEKIDDKGCLALAQSRLAQIYAYTGSLGEALVFCERALQLAQQYAPSAVKSIQTLLTQIKRKRLK